MSTTEMPAAPDKAGTSAPKKPAATTMAPTIATAEIELPPGPTFAPIMRAAPMTLLDLLFRRPAVQPRVAQVLVTGRGQMLLSAPDNPLPTIDLLTRGVRRIYEVDLGRHETYLHALLPSSSAAADFVAVIDLHWRVVRAVDVVNDGITDVGSTLRPRILVLLRDVTRHHTTDDLELAEKKAAAALQQENLGEAYGLEVTAFLRQDAIHTVIPGTQEARDDVLGGSRNAIPQ